MTRVSAGELMIHCLYFLYSPKYPLVMSTSTRVRAIRAASCFAWSLSAT